MILIGNMFSQKKLCVYVCKTRRIVKKHVTRCDMPRGCLENKLKFRFTKIVDYLCKNIKYLYLHIVSKNSLQEEKTKIDKFYDT